MPFSHLPPGFFPLDRICANCHGYGFKWRPAEEGIGHAFCFLKQGYFKFQLNDQDPSGAEHKPPGERTGCKDWVQKGTVNYGTEAI